MACPICNKEKKIFSIKVKDYEYDLKLEALYSQCKSCKSIYRSYPSKIKKWEKKIYSKKKYLPLKGNIIYDLLKGIYSKYEIKKIAEVLDKNFFKRQSTILDIACGKGYLIRNLSKNKNFKCFGTDINISTTKKDNVNFIKSSYDNIKLIKKINPDLIIINNFVEHVENLTNIGKIVHQIKKGSYVIIITPDGNSFARKKFSNYWSGYHSPRHNVIFNSKSIKQIFPKRKKIKFKQIKIYDPFTNIISISNLIKQIMHSFVPSDIFKITNFLLHLFIDIRQKNRILMIVKKL